MAEKNATAEEIMFALIRFELFSKQFSAYFRSSIDEDMLKSLYVTSKKHNMAHLIADALEKNGIIKDGVIGYDAFHKHLTMALFKYEGQKFVADKLFSAFEAEGIDFIPLKGAVLRYAYPEPWMRSSCDIDVLVRKEDIGRASDLCEKTLGFTDKSAGPHDVGFVSDNVQIELHYELIESNPKAIDVFLNVFDKTKKADGFEHKLIMDDDMLYFYHIAHIEKHFLHGGCGIRPIADLIILDNAEGADVGKRNELLEKTGLLTFANGVRELSKVWFEQKMPTELTERLGAFILKGGTFGNTATRVSMARANRNGFTYLTRRIFPAPWQMKIFFPILKEHPILLPVMYVKRIFNYLATRTTAQSMNEIKTNAFLDEQSAKESLWLMENLGILSDSEGIM